ncbi:hypothetical protein G3M48_000764, partial [Beauveria asiatica]
ALKTYLLDDLGQAAVQMAPHSANVGSRQGIPHRGLENGSQNGMLHDTNKTGSRKRASHDLGKEQAGPNKKGLKTTTTVPCEQNSHDEQIRSTFVRPETITESVASFHDGRSQDDQDAAPVAVFKIIDADGFPQGELKQFGSWGAKRVDNILKRSVRRPIQLRRGRRFSPERLSAMRDNGVSIVSWTTNLSVVVEIANGCVDAVKVPPQLRSYR